MCNSVGYDSLNLHALHHISPYKMNPKRANLPFPSAQPSICFFNPQLESHGNSVTGTSKMCFPDWKRNCRVAMSLTCLSMLFWNASSPLKMPSVSYLFSIISLKRSLSVSDSPPFKLWLRSNGHWFIPFTRCWMFKQWWSGNCCAGSLEYLGEQPIRKEKSSPGILVIAKSYHGFLTKPIPSLAVAFYPDTTLSPQRSPLQPRLLQIYPT